MLSYHALDCLFVTQAAQHRGCQGQSVVIVTRIRLPLADASSWDGYLCPSLVRSLVPRQ